MYYVLDNLCPTLEDAEEVVLLYKIAGVPASIVTEADYFLRIHWDSVVLRQSPDDYWNDTVIH
jgi:hypothetical protein